MVENHEGLWDDLQPYRSGFRSLHTATSSRRARLEYEGAFTGFLIDNGCDETFAQMINVLQRDFNDATTNFVLPWMYPCGVSRFGVRYYYEPIPERRIIAWERIRELCKEYAVRRGLYVLTGSGLAFSTPREWREWNWVS